MEVFALNEVEGVEVLGGREAVFRAGDVESAHPLVTEANGEFGHLEAAVRLAHRRDEGAHDDAVAFGGRVSHADVETDEDRRHHFVERQAREEVLLGSETNFGVDDTFAGEVERRFGGDALELILGLHERRGVGEAFEVTNEV